MLSRFSTIEGQLRATGTTGSEDETSYSRSRALRRAVEQFDEKDKFEFMLLDTVGGCAHHLQRHLLPGAGRRG